MKFASTINGGTTLPQASAALFCVPVKPSFIGLLATASSINRQNESLTAQVQVGTLRGLCSWEVL